MLPPLPVLQCADPTAPAMECQTTRIFGVPRGTVGRGANQITAIAVHGIDDTYQSYLHKMCVSGKLPVGCHASMHYVIDGDTGAVTRVVREEDVAWAWQSYTGNFPVTTPRDCCRCPTPCPQQPCPEALDCVPANYIWPVQTALHPNLAADLWSINIGIVSPNRPEQTALDNVDCCVTPYGISQRAYDTLVRLVAWIQSRYPTILLNSQHIVFHDDVVNRAEGCFEFPCGANGVCFVCDVSAYCETCNNVGDPTLTIITEGVQWVYVETTGGCRAKIRFTDFVNLVNGA